MLKRDPAFRRVKAGGHGPLGSASYWLGRDHLLVVAMAGYVENYRRFLFADIQAVVVQKSRARMVWSVVLAVLAVPCLAGCLTLIMQQPIQGRDAGYLVLLGMLLGLAAVLGTLLVANWLRGPTCVCYVRTAVQTSTLPNLTRWRQAQRLLTALTPLVMEAQARLAAAETPVQPPGSAPSDATTNNPAAGTPRYVVDDPNAPPRIIP